MSHLLSSTAVARTALFAGVLLAIMMLSLSSFLPAFAQESETIEYAEDRTDEVVAYTAVDPEGKDIAWTLGGADAGAFDITDGVLTFKNQPDHDVKDSYTVTVTASDGDADNDQTWTLTINIIDVDEPGTVVLGNRQPQLNTSLSATLSDPDGLGSPDVEADEISIRWRWAISNSSNGPWTNIRRLRSGELTSTYPTNGLTSTYTPHSDDVGSYLRATATYTDGHGENKTQSAVSENPVVRNLVNDPPVFVYVEGDEIPVDAPDANDEVGEPIHGDSPTTPRKVAENSPAGTNVGAPVKAIDEDGDTVTYELSGADAAWFDIDTRSGQVSVKARADNAMLNKEAPADSDTDGTYTVTITAKDPSYTSGTVDTTSDTITVNIEITDVPEAPSINKETNTTGLTAISTPENTLITAAALSTYTATDDEDDVSPQKVLKWSLSGADSGMFQLCDVATDAICAAPTGDVDTAELRFKESPDYEALSSAQQSNGLNLTVTVTDSDDMTDSRNVTVTVTNEDEDGVVTLSNLQPQVGTPIRASLTDPDGSATNVRWQWASSSNQSPDNIGQLTQPSTSNAYTPVAGDLGRWLFAFASYTDPEGSGKTATSTLPTTSPADYPVKAKNEYCTNASSRTDSNNAEYFLCTSHTNGNKPPVFPDQDTTVQGFQNSRTMSIAEDTGDSASPRNIGTGDEFTATDDQNIACENSAIRTATGCHNLRNNATSTTEANVLATTTVANTGIHLDRLTYSLEGPDKDSFTINRQTGQIMTKAYLDYETKKVYSVSVKVTDPTGSTGTNDAGRGTNILVTIEVTDVEEDPDITVGEASIKIPENTATSTVLSTYTATDDEDDYDDPNDDNNEIVPLKWSLSGTDSDDFELSAETGASTNLMFKESLSFESPKDRDTNGETAADNVYRVTVTATDSDGDATSREVTVIVTNAEEDGTVTLSAQQPQVDVELTAKLIDPDGEVNAALPLTLNNSDQSDDNLTGNLAGEDEATWQWARSTSRTGGWTDIEDARSYRYTAATTDVGYYLRASATYDDGHGEDKSKSAVSSHPVRAKIYTNSAPVFVYVQGDEIPGDPYPDLDNDANNYPDDLDRDANIDEYAVGDEIPDVNGTSATVTREVPENSPSGTNVGHPLFAKDIGENGRQENLTYRLVDPVPANTATDDEDFFTINGGTGQIRVKTGTMLNREAKPTYTVTVRVTDSTDTGGDLVPLGDKSRDEIEVVISVTNVPEAPKITAGDTATSTSEATTTPPAIRAVLATYTATDDEDDAASPQKVLKWSLSGADSGMFRLCDELSSAADACDTPTGDVDTVQLKFKDSPDFEAKADANGDNDYEVTVIATDSDDMSASRDVTVTVTNDEETGTVTLSNLQPQVGTPIRADLTDPDGSVSNLRWQWASYANADRSDSPQPQLTQPSTSNAYTPVVGDLGRYLFAFASYTDPEGSKKTATSTLPTSNTAAYLVKVKNEYCTAATRLTDNAGTPSNPSDDFDYFRCSRTANGNTSPVFPDQDTNVQGFQNATSMSIAENTASGVNIGSPVTAFDDSENIACTAASINNSNGCHNLRNNATSTAPATPPGVLATTTVTDLLTYSLEGTDASSFAINRATGQIVTKAPLDYEGTKKSYSVSVKTTDPTGTTATNPSGTRTNIIVTINVTYIHFSGRVNVIICCFCKLNIKRFYVCSANINKFQRHFVHVIP